MICTPGTEMSTKILSAIHKTMKIYMYHNHQTCFAFRNVINLIHVRKYQLVIALVTKVLLQSIYTYVEPMLEE